MGRRIDGMNILRCETCGLGVVEVVPATLDAYYDDAYYGVEKSDDAIGYGDYRFTSEHGLSWAAAMVRILKPGGRILDIGCADGTLLAKLPSTFDRYGIEVNERMAMHAAKAGVEILGRDLLDPAIAREHRGRFDVVTSIAVFEHLSDLRRGMRISLDLLKPDGVLLFEVPYISTERDNRIWFESSLEHVFYPSGNALRRLIEDLGAHLVGGEVYIRDYASNYIGIAFHDGAMASDMQCLFNALTSVEGNLPVEQHRARQQLMLVHAAESTADLLVGLGTLPSTALNPSLMRRFEQLWGNDLRRLAYVRGERDGLMSEHAVTIAERDRLISDLEVAKTDLEVAKTDLEVAKTGHEVAKTDLEVAKTDHRIGVMNLIYALEAAESGLRQSRDEAITLRECLAETRDQLDRIAHSSVWKATFPLRRWGSRNPQAAKYIRQTMKLIWWSARLELPSRLREVRERRRAITPIPTDEVSTALPEMPPLVFRNTTGLVEPVTEDDEIDPWPMGRPLISVVITSFNYGRFVAEAVDSVLSQTFADLEVIVVEGGSTDPESRRLTLALDRPRTRIVAQSTPHSAGANRNFGISHARGKYICCLDADDMLAPTYIEKALFLLESYGYDAVSSALRYFGHRDDCVGILETPTLADMLEANHMLTCAVFRRSLWRTAGGFRDTDVEVTGYIYEDWLFWVRLAALDARMHNMSRDYMFRYRRHGPSLSTRTNQHPDAVHREMVRRSVADLAGADTIRRSRLAAAVLQRSRQPHRNLVRRTPHDARRPVLLLALPFMIVGGAERLLSDLMRHLVTQGWRVVIITSVDPGAEHGDTTEWFEGATNEIYHLPRFLAPERWRDFVRYLVISREVNLVWIVGSAFMYEFLPDLRGQFPRIRVADLLFNTVGHTADNRKYAQLIDIIFVENREVRQFLRDSGEAEERIALVTSGVDLHVYRPGPRDPEVVRRIRVLPDELVVGFSGRFSPEKDPLAFVEIAVRSLQLPIRFVMTGAGAMRQEIEAAVHAANLPEGRFHLVGEVKDVVPWLRSYDLLILPSRLDGRPVVVMEALASGVPVLASKVGALPELIDDGVNGFLCQPGRVTDFVERLGLLAGDRRLLDGMEAAARTCAEQHLGAEMMLMRYEERLRAVIHDADHVSGGVWTGNDHHADR